MKLSRFWTTFLTTPQLAAALSRSHYGRDGSHSNSSHSAFVYATVYGNVTFALTAVKDVGDLYFHIEAPAKNSWIAVGTGSQMKGSTMWVAYRSDDEKGVTLSPRSTTRHLEPSHDEKIDCQITSHEGVVNGVVNRHGHDIFAVNGYCKDINKKSGRSEKRHGGSQPGDNNAGDGIIDFDSAQQSFIFALGPTDRHLHSNDKDAQIKRHSLFGHFQIDITKSTVKSTSDVSYDELSSIATWENHGAQLIGGVTKDRDWSGNIHSLLMCTAYVLMFPVGVVFLRLLEKVRWHWWMQVVGVGFVLLGLGLGIWAALEYNHTKRFNSAHQLIGFSVVGATLVQLALGFTHHLLYKKKQRRTVFGHIHVYLGPVVMSVGIANGFVGFRLSGGSYHNIMYGIFVGVFMFGLLGALFWAHKRRQSRRRENERVADEAYEEFKRVDEYRGAPLKGEYAEETHSMQSIDISRETPVVPEDEGKPVQPMVLV